MCVLLMNPRLSFGASGAVHPEDTREDQRGIADGLQVGRKVAAGPGR